MISNSDFEKAADRVCIKWQGDNEKSRESDSLPFNIKRFVFLPKSNFSYCASKVKCCGSHTEGLEDTAYSRNTDAVALF